LLVRIHENRRVIVAKTEIDGQVSNGRKVVLHIEAGLPALAPTLEWRKDIRVTAAVEEKAFAFAEPDKVNPRFEEMSAPGV